ncbi:MAG: pyruvate dehydrogenase (acetyl-transferring) E1 component subunit alpha [Candidatus Elarobacter sp.]
MVSPQRILDPSGTLTPGAAAPLEDGDVLAALRLMKLSRAFDAKGASLQRQGRFGTFSQVGGQEASVVGSAWALDPTRDWVVPQYRELPALLRHGYPLSHFIMYFQGNPAGGAIPEGVNILPIQISIAAQLPHAVGLAWGLKRQGKDAVVLVYFGDGASSEGDFHEACNLAGLVGAPVVFFLQNNGWAISTPRRKQSAGRTLAERAPAYGFPGEQVDGNDLFAVYAAASRAVSRARCGDGPTLIESLTQRIGPHNTADDPTRYVDPAEAERWRALDPIDRVERYLARRNAGHRAHIAAFDADIAAEIERALAQAAQGASLGADQLFAHVYAEPPLRLTRQRAERAQGHA